MTEYIADVAIPPGETLLELIESNNMTQAELAQRIGFSKKHVNEIIKGKSAITAETAVKLENIFSPPASFWINLEANCRAALVRTEEKQSDEEKKITQKIPYTEMADYEWVPRTSNFTDKIINLRNFFRVSNLSHIRETPAYSAAFRTAKKDQTSSLALAAWLEKGISEANKIKTKSFSKDKLEELIPVLRKMTQMNPNKFHDNLVSLLADSGIAFVLVPYLENTYAHGAVKWLSKDKVMVQLSLRYKYADIFWFSFFHELGHILLHGKRNEYIEYDETKNVKKEKEADEFAKNILIPENNYEDLLQKGEFDRDTIIRFAKKLEISPDIVVGRLCHDNILDYHIHSDFRRQYDYKDFRRE